MSNKIKVANKIKGSLKERFETALRERAEKGAAIREKAHKTGKMPTKGGKLDY